MAQKWNLGDIVPPDRERRSRPRPQAPHHGMGDMRRPMRPGGERPAPHHHEDDPALHHEGELHHHANEHVEDDSLDAEIRDIEIKVGKSHRMRRYLTIVAVIAIAIGLGIGSTILMSGADVTVMPKSRSVTVNGTFDAHQNPKAGELGYELLSFEEEGERTVSATGQEKVTERASGMITIQNAHSSTKQRLVKNTRFESPNGLIYRITESVEIPGYTKSDDGTIIPGSIEAKVLADGTGEEYNIAPSSFTVPGLKGSEQFDTITGTSKEAMVGGFDGMKFIIDEGELAKARQELHLELREKLFARLKTDRPSGFVFYEPSVTFVFNSLPPTDAGNQSVTIAEQARLLAPLFKTDDFARTIAARAIPGYEGEPVRIDDVSSLTFSYPSPVEDISAADPLQFNLSGQAKIIWTYDVEKLRNDLKGVAKTALPSILSGYPAIEKSRASVKPFWKDSFPKDIQKIRIIESFDSFTQ